MYTAKGSGSVNGFSCTKYEGDLSGVKESEVCAALPAQIKLTPADLQIFEKMKQFSSTLVSSLANSPVHISVPSGYGFDEGYEGFPIQKTDFENGQATKRSELKSITRTNFTDADFSLGNAKKIEAADSRRARQAALGGAERYLPPGTVTSSIRLSCPHAA